MKRRNEQQILEDCTKIVQNNKKIKYSAFLRKSNLSTTAAERYIKALKMLGIIFDTKKIILHTTKYLRYLTLKETI